jgi:hypothetical protein
VPEGYGNRPDHTVDDHLVSTQERTRP